MWAIIGYILLFAVKLFSAWTARKKEKKENLIEGGKKLKEAIKNRDVQGKLNAFDRIRNA